jgi:23S rRNA (adenine2503-C2)-methyltransferase
MNFLEIADFVKEFYRSGERKVTLNFALSPQIPVDPRIVRTFFDPQQYLIKITPLNPTISAKQHQLASLIQDEAQAKQLLLVKELQDLGYEVIISIGETEENKIGSNCGLYVRKFIENNGQCPAQSYQYNLIPVTD